MHSAYELLTLDAVLKMQDSNYDFDRSIIIFNLFDNLIKDWLYRYDVQEEEIKVITEKFGYAIESDESPMQFMIRILEDHMLALEHSKEFRQGT